MRTRMMTKLKTCSLKTTVFLMKMKTRRRNSSSQIQMLLKTKVSPILKDWYQMTQMRLSCSLHHALHKKIVHTMTTTPARKTAATTSWVTRTTWIVCRLRPWTTTWLIKAMCSHPLMAVKWAASCIIIKKICSTFLTSMIKIFFNKKIKSINL